MIKLLRIKAYHKTEKRMYKVAIMNWESQQITVFDKEKELKNFHFCEVSILERSPYTVLENDKYRAIFKGDFLIATLGEERRVSGVVKRQKCGLWILENKKTKLEIPLSFLFKEEWKIKNLNNSLIYFQRKK
ncbi:hypothetical protein HMPREF3206_00050 [Fusobacterium equinum]|uniref:YopX protein domain-containing protein n=1 Tax=Fusobacterium equinum TaxID=134605 RepID=A0A133NLC7_9FUSO|nr:hypothetical protein HMPREF3206_00050 [Fusobacterium equinum]